MCCVQANRTLTTLDISDNQINTEGALAFAECLQVAVPRATH